jgi:hypothetical protein
MFIDRVDRAKHPELKIVMQKPLHVRSRALSTVCLNIISPRVPWRQVGQSFFAWPPHPAQAAPHAVPCAGQEADALLAPYNPSLCCPQTI